ncbi:hypothetical protein AYX14_07095 [Cryptococcus neoformans]|nr:hypothetical protein AYX14_07095 [Cryptococcus neoformans var. grubii]
MPSVDWDVEEDGASIYSTDSEGEEGESRERRLATTFSNIMERGAQLENPEDVAKIHEIASNVLPGTKVDGNPVLSKKNLFQLESMMGRVIVPPYIDTVGKGFFTKQAKPTASQWRTWGEILGPLLMPWLWAVERSAGVPLPDQELTAAMKLFAIVSSSMTFSTLLFGSIPTYHPV